MQPAKRLHHAPRVSSACPWPAPLAMRSLRGLLRRAAVCACVFVRARPRHQPLCTDCGTPITVRDYHHQCDVCQERRRLSARHEEAAHAVAAEPPASAPSPPPPLFARPQGCLDQLTLIQRAAIVTLHAEGYTRNEIAEKLHCSPHAVTRWVHRWNQTHSLEDAERSGRPRLIDEGTSQAIDDYSCEHKTAEPKDIRRELQLPVSARAIRRELNSVGLLSHVQRYEHELTEFDIQRRLAFANQYLNWTEDQWARVFFSDECNFYLGHHGRVHVQCPIGASHDAEYLHAAPQLHGKVSLWGCICAEGLGHAELYAGALDSTRHRDILRHSLIPSFRQFYPDGPWFFQQDNVRFHTTPDTVTFLHEKGVTLIDWPPWSPDLNPIENLWNVLKARVYARFPQTMEEMEQFIREEHAASDLTFISRICRNMPRRLRLLLANKGHKIPY
jgi:transposase